MMDAIEDYLADIRPSQARVLAIFDYLDEWFREPDFRGCPWMNVYGELGPTNPAVAAEAHHHQRAFRALVTGRAIRKHVLSHDDRGWVRPGRTRFACR
ncbi:hypothetical protein [Streptosporangium subroseum]|uniref:hypothetical protein n=1 Tax=Streptosporangium subroseum TaxID=106412 RepID=UPI00308A53FE|nr:hypothetical protein OHB15_23150 [Streptosporangium subroseum]